MTYLNNVFKDAINNPSPRKIVSLNSDSNEYILSSTERYIVMSAIRDIIFKPPGHKVLITTEPASLKRIITAIRNDLYNHPYLYGEVMIQRDVSAPWHELVLRNGNRIRGFVSDGHGVSLRGQDGNALYVHDYKLDKKYYQSYIFPILQSVPETRLEIVLANTELPANNPEFIGEMLDPENGMAYNFHTEKEPIQICYPDYYYLGTKLSKNEDTE